MTSGRQQRRKADPVAWEAHKKTAREWHQRNRMRVASRKYGQRECAREIAHKLAKHLIGALGQGISVLTEQELRDPTFRRGAYREKLSDSNPPE